MKKLNSLFAVMIALFGTMFLASCGSDDEDPLPAPTLVISSVEVAGTSQTSKTVNLPSNAGATDIVITYRATAGSRFESIRSTVRRGNSTTPGALNKTSGFDSNTEDLDTWAFSVPASEPLGTIELEITVTDRDNRTVTDKVTINKGSVQSASGLYAIGQNTATGDPVPNDLNLQTAGIFFNGNTLTNVNTSLAASNVSEIDWAFGYISGQARIVTPSNAPTSNAAFLSATPKRVTRFNAVPNTFDFDNASAASINSLTAGTGSDFVVSSGSVFSYNSTVNGVERVGVVRVTTLQNINAASNKGFIRFEVKILQ